MRRTQITEGFYWVDRRWYGLTVGEVCMEHDCEGTRFYVMFPGSSVCHRIGTPDAANPMRIESRRFKQRIEEYAKPVRVGKESWE